MKKKKNQNNIKTLKFYPPLPDLILSGEKTTTWRVNDEKNLNTGDIIDLINSENLELFEKAKIINVKVTTFGELNEEDFVGHEKFESIEKMYETYSKYYKTNINKDTELKIINFKTLGVS